MQLHERLRRLRKYYELTQQEMADRIGVSKSSVVSYENKRAVPSASVITIICSEFNVNHDWIEFGTGEMIKPMNRYQEISRMFDMIVKEEDPLKDAIVKLIAEMDSDTLSMLKKKIKEIADDLD